MLFINKAYILFVLILASCGPVLPIARKNGKSVSGTEYYQEVMLLNWRQRDSLAFLYFKEGNIPEFQKKLVPVIIRSQDTVAHKKYKAVIYVTRDYFSIGTNADWARVPITPVLAQKISDEFNCFLPTAKIVDEIYNAAKVKLDPVPMYAFRDSSVTMWQHHLIIEGQKKGRKGLIAGIKKDIIITNKLNNYPKNDRVAIYGWHRMNGQPIQPVYTGHVNWYVDYSHGVRLIYKKIKINGKWMDYQAVLKDPVLSQVISNEGVMTYFSYPDNCE